MRTESLRQIQAVNLFKTFGGVQALAGVTIDFSAGPIYGVIGPNGAGKTTLLNMISGIDVPTSGQILFDGAEMSGLAAHDFSRSGVARTYQNIKLFVGLTVIENVLVGFANQSSRGLIRSLIQVRSDFKERHKFQSEAETLLDKFDLLNKKDVDAHDLSYGEQRRLEIARALATRPSFLLLDEPTAGMNKKESGDLAELIFKLNSSGLTVIVVEHNIGFVQEISEQVFCMAGGNIISRGSAEDVLNDVAVRDAYLGASPKARIDRLREVKAKKSLLDNAKL